MRDPNSSFPTLSCEGSPCPRPPPLPESNLVSQSPRLEDVRAIEPPKASFRLHEHSAETHASTPAAHAGLLPGASAGPAGVAGVPAGIRRT